MIPHSEDDILALLDAHFPRSGRGLLLGRGDDCALLAPEAQPRAIMSTGIILALLGPFQDKIFFSL